MNLLRSSIRTLTEPISLIYTENLLQEILLGIHSMCVGAESKFFNGHTNIKTDRFVVFGVKGLLQARKILKMLYCLIRFHI